MCQQQRCCALSTFTFSVEHVENHCHQNHDPRHGHLNLMLDVMPIQTTRREICVSLFDYFD
jgi:hypothetical protein